MKKLFFIALIIAFSGVASAQNKEKIASDISKKESYLKSQSNSVAADSKDVQNQIKEQLVSNKGMGQKTIGFLKSNPDTASSLREIYKGSDGSISDIMKSVMNDPKLSNKVMDWVNNNPEMLSQAMSLIGM